MTTINRERFEAWLFSQPLDREFDYTDPNGCAICAFIKETTSEQNPLVSPAQVIRPEIEIPAWLDDSRWRTGPQFITRGVAKVHPLTIANMQARYLELFPDALTVPAIPESTLEPQPKEKE